MYANKRKSLAQNFLAKAHLTATLVNDSSIDLRDIIYEIGPGKGILTKELAKRAKKVIAIEKDRKLYMKLLKKFASDDKIILHHADFLEFKIDEPLYKIFANVPFNITSALIRKLLFDVNPPIEAYLIIQKEGAEKFIGAPKTTQFSVLLKPWFRMTIIKYFKRTDFSPIPNVNVVMLHIEKRIPPLISRTDMPVYQRFIKCGFGARRKNLKSNYKNVFSHRQWKRLSCDLTFSTHAKPSELRFEQWLGLFRFFRNKSYMH